MAPSSVHDRYDDDDESSSSKPPTIVFHLRTPLYTFATAVSLTSLILLIVSGDGFHRRRGEYYSGGDDLILIPTIILFLSAMTGPVLFTFWTIGLFVRVRWAKLKRGDQNEGGGIRIGADGQEARASKKSRAWSAVVTLGKVLLSWNAWLAAALAAALGITIWTYVENARGRIFMVEAGYGAALIGVSCILHLLLAIPALSDKKFVVSIHPFKEAYQLAAGSDNDSIEQEE